MSQFERENDEAFAMVRENRRRCRVCRTVGVIVPIEEARQIAVKRCREAQASPSVAGVFLMAMTLFAVTAAGVLILV